MTGKDPERLGSAPRSEKLRSKEENDQIFRIAMNQSFGFLLKNLKLIVRFLAWVGPGGPVQKCESAQWGLSRQQPEKESGYNRVETWFGSGGFTGLVVALRSESVHWWCGS
jgi:hypothetical protein